METMSRILMGYFRELPNIEYRQLSDAVSSQDYLTVKNLFRRNKLRDDKISFDKYMKFLKEQT